MTCCTGPCAVASHFNPKKADRDLRRYQRHGPDISTRILLSEIRRWPLQGLHLLDVGAGIGVIALELAGAGLAGVTLADASADYLEAARRHLASRDASLRAQFILGDFAATAGSGYCGCASAKPATCQVSPDTTAHADAADATRTSGIMKINRVISSFPPGYH